MQVYDTAECCHRETLLYVNSRKMGMYAIDSIAIQSDDDDACSNAFLIILRVLSAKSDTGYLHDVSVISAKHRIIRQLGIAIPTNRGRSENSIRR